MRMCGLSDFPLGKWAHYATHSRQYILMCEQDRVRTDLYRQRTVTSDERASRVAPALQLTTAGATEAMAATATAPVTITGDTTWMDVDAYLENSEVTWTSPFGLMCVCVCEREC